MKNKLLWLVLSAGTILTIYGFYLSSSSFSDFAGYYTSSKIILEADQPALLYNDKFFVNKMHSFGIPDSTFIMYVNPPPSSFIMIPVAWINPSAAKTVWNIFNLIFLAAGLFLFLRFNKISMDLKITPPIAAVFICTVPYLRNLHRGQIYILLLLFVILFFHGYLQRNSFLSSLSLAVLFLLKYFGWIFFILFIMEKRWKELVLTCVFILTGFLFASILFGIESYSENFKTILAANSRKDFLLTGLPCIPAFFGSLFTFHPQWNIYPVLNISGLPAVLTAVSFLIMLIISIRQTEKNTKERLSSLLVLSLIFTPLAADHHYIILALPAAYMILNTVEIKFLKLLPIFMVLYLLLGWYPEVKMQILSGWAKLLAYPRLYGAILMWILLLFSFRPQAVK